MNKKISVTHIINSFEIGGLEKLIYYFIKELDRGLIEPSIIALEDKGELKADFESLSIHMISLNKRPGTDWAIIPEIVRNIKTIEPDIVHTHNLGAHFYGSIGSLLTHGSFAKIHTQHSPPDDFGMMKMIKHRFLDRRNDHLVCVSNEIKYFLEKKWKPRCNLLTIHNGIMAQEANSQCSGKIKMELAIPQNGKIIGHVGRLVPVKNQFLLLEAFYKVCNRLSETYLILVGDGPMMKELSFSAEQMGIADQVRLVGYREDVLDLLSSFDVFVLSSLSEGLSVALLEAMSVGIPVIATDVGGNKDILQAGHNGILVPTKDSEKMAEEIFKVLTDTKLSSSLGRAAMKTVRTEYSMSRMVGAYMDIYSKALEEKGLLPT